MSVIPFVAVNIGNTRTQVAVCVDGSFRSVVPVTNGEPTAIASQIMAAHKELADPERAPVVIASVNPPVAQAVVGAIRGELKAEVYLVGDDMPAPIGTQLDPETITGVDRLLNAAAAFAVLEQACVVVDAGTAVTVDFVDGAGVFHGGAIAPGAEMQLRALHEFTAALPEVSFAVPDDEAFGRSTGQAMLRGAFFGIRGLVWKLTERYAEAYGAYPSIIATGGNAEMIFGDDELVDRIVPNLTLMGIVEAVRLALEDSASGRDSSDDRDA